MQKKYYNNNDIIGIDACKNEIIGKDNTFFWILFINFICIFINLYKNITLYPFNDWVI